MERKINQLPEEIQEISIEEYNLLQINSIGGKYKELRQLSKAPTFRLNLSRYLVYFS